MIYIVVLFAIRSANPKCTAWQKVCSLSMQLFAYMQESFATHCMPTAKLQAHH